MKLFAPYASELEAFVDSNLVETSGSDSFPHDYEGLDPYGALRSLVPIEDLRSMGVFFTGPELAARLWTPALETLDGQSIIVDPACGAGDLLLPAAEYLTASGRSLTNLSAQIRGSDLEDSFLRTARARLRLRHSRKMIENFNHLERKDFIVDSSSVQEATHVVMNPPFFAAEAPKGCTWARGKVNSAALFTMRALESMKPGSRLLAILPDVLRSGARYSKWRQRLSTLGQIIRVEPQGQFDSETDVHVFILDVIVRESFTENDMELGFSWTQGSTSGSSTVSDHFEVRVGPVVPHRDPEKGPEAIFLTTKSLAESLGAQETRRFAGRLFSGPMVLVSRTSRPGQVPRARATLWDAENAAAVENHLLVLRPNNESVEMCHRLVDVLSDSRTTEFLDARIRCRHLTVGAVREIPWLGLEPE